MYGLASAKHEHKSGTVRQAVHMLAFFSPLISLLKEMKCLLPVLADIIVSSI